MTQLAVKLAHPKNRNKKNNPLRPSVCYFLLILDTKKLVVALLLFQDIRRLFFYFEKFFSPS